LDKEHIKIVAQNRKARHDYFIVAEYEAGLVLEGTEVKSLRLGLANLKDSYARIIDGEVFVYQLHISAYPFAYYDNHEPLRPRKLLLHKHEIKRLYGKVNEKGHTLIPLRLFFKNGKVKIVLALVKESASMTSVMPSSVAMNKGSLIAKERIIKLATDPD